MKFNKKYIGHLVSYKNIPEDGMGLVIDVRQGIGYMVLWTYRHIHLTTEPYLDGSYGVTLYEPNKKP